MSNISGDEESFSSGEAQQNKEKTHRSLASMINRDGSTSKHQQQSANKKRRNLPGNPDPTAEVVALSPKTLMATNRFVCEICNKGFQRDQNLQLHRRGHNLPWKLRQRTSSELANKKRVYICPEPACVHHNPSRALGDLTGIKKHYSRKHGEKKWKCDKCSKKYAVQSDWKAHLKTCGLREYKCDCGTIFSRRDSFITHRAFCDALNEENNKVNETLMGQNATNLQAQTSTMQPNTSNTSIGPNFNNPLKSLAQDFIPIPFNSQNMFSTTSGPLLSPRTIPPFAGLQLGSNIPSPSSFHHHNDNINMGHSSVKAQMSATALLQKAAQISSTTANNSINSPLMQKSFVSSMAGHNQISGPPGSKPNSNLQAYDNIQAQVDQQTPPSTGGYVSDVGGMLMISGGDRQISDVGFLNNRAVDVHNHDFVDQSGNNSNAAARDLTIYGGERYNSDHMTTVDFLGVGGSQPQIQDEGVNLFNQQVSIHGDSDVAKRLYNDFR